MKSTLIAGDTLQFVTEVPDYPASDGWTLKYRLVPQASGPTPITITASADDDAYQVNVGSNVTANWTAGEYAWVACVETGSERHTVEQGTCTIKPNPLTATTLDGRSHARKALEAIKAVIENRATLDQQEYTIHGRQVKRLTVPELLKFRARYEAEVKAEEQAEKLAAGLPVGGKLQVRF